MGYATYSAEQAVSRANAVAKWQTAMCLNFVFNCLTEVSAGLYDANAAWTAAKQKETSTPPAGAPVYFAGYTHGHIAISLGGGRIRSTDVPYATPKGTLAPVGNTTIGDIERDWGITYRGWSRDYAGQIIRGLEETSTNYSPPPVIPVPEEDPLAGITLDQIVNAVWSTKWTSPIDGQTQYAASSWVIGANQKAGEAKAIANEALSKVNALAADRDQLIADVTKSVLNAPVLNHDENPDDNVPPDAYAFRSYPVMANWRASQIQGEVADLKAQLATVVSALTTLTAKVDALPKG